MNYRDWKADVVALLTSPENYVDGLHLNEADQLEIAKVVWRDIR